jgi:hypothetical protein
MAQTLITRITKLEQYNAKKKEILWKDITESRWQDGNVYALIRLNDNAIFIATDILYIGKVSSIKNGQSILCVDVQVINCSNDQFLQIHANYPELISRVKANFPPFIHPQALNIKKIISDANNKNFVDFYILSGISKYNELFSKFKVNDRIILLDAANQFEDVKLHTTSGLSDFSLDLGVHIGVTGLTLDKMLAINKAIVRKSLNSNNVKRIETIKNELTVSGIYKFKTFFSYHDTLYNKFVYSDSSPVHTASGAIPLPEYHSNGAINNSLNTIFYGPPGTGKTYSTVLRAAEIIENRKITEYDEALKVFNTHLGDRIEFITFHQNYSYEDFIQGLRPDVDNGTELRFERKDGVFKRIADRALKNLINSSNPETITQRKNYVIVIDEINRANISRVFGELITLIEKDKRSHGEIPMRCTLPSGEEFIVPSNLYIIGTMNTADKSIALLDIALRRRFEFEPMYPLYEIDGHEIYDVEVLLKINTQIKKLKGYDFQIGHSYFMGENKDLLVRMNKKVIPLLLEYFMNDEKEVKGILLGAGLSVEQDSWPLKINGRL